MPDETKDVTVTVRMSSEMQDKIRADAETEHRTWANMLRVIVERYYDGQKRVIEIEKRPMSSWSAAELAEYNRLTGQEDEPIDEMERRTR